MIQSDAFTPFVTPDLIKDLSHHPLPKATEKRVKDTDTKIIFLI